MSSYPYKYNKKEFTAMSNENVKSITVSTDRSYSDIDCAFVPRPSGDIYKKVDVEAVRQSVKNILMTNHGEKPFAPKYGGGLNRFLFSLSTEMDVSIIAKEVSRAIQVHEPRANIVGIEIDISPDYNSMNVNVLFEVLNYPQPVSVNVVIGRAR